MIVYNTNSGTIRDGTARFVYFIADINSDAVKIGQAKNMRRVYARLQNHQCGCPSRLKLIGVMKTCRTDTEVRRTLMNLGFEPYHHEWLRGDAAEMMQKYDGDE